MDLNNNTVPLEGGHVKRFTLTFHTPEWTPTENLSRILLFAIFAFLIIIIILAKLLQRICLQKCFRRTPVSTDQTVHLPDIISDLQ